MKNSVIEIKNVSKSFKAVHAVKDLSLTIYQGEYIALLGPNGAGKTTLIEMIEGIQNPDQGEIMIMGRRWKDNGGELHHLIGLSFQETKFIDKLTAEETLNMFGSFYNLGKNRTEEILDLVNLQAKRKSYTSTLSGGQRQRLALGVALLNNPRIILLDEPTTGLDPGARRDIWEILERLRKEYGTTMILTTHYMEEAEYLCDRILIMDQGKFLAEGTLEELIQKHGEGEIIEITLDKKIPLSENSVKGIKKLSWNSLKAKIFVESITETLPELINYTAENQSTILELGCRKMTLDDLFISMTGRHLHES